MASAALEPEQVRCVAALAVAANYWIQYFRPLR
jgi:hypothetical protein